MGAVYVAAEAQPIRPLQLFLSAGAEKGSGSELPHSTKCRGAKSVMEGAALSTTSKSNGGSDGNTNGNGDSNCGSQTYGEAPNGSEKVAGK